MTTFWTTLIDRRADLLTALGQHLTISLIALVIAMMIAIPLAIWVQHHERIAEGFLQLTGALQTIPSLALLGLLIPIVGIGNVPAIIALIIYALLPIFQNTYLGIHEIDAALTEAADAFGMSFWRKLFKVQLPIAMPTIISGIRQAVILIIGTATLAALIGAGGLGTFILTGIDRNNPTLTLIGAIAAALLAMIVSALIYGLQRWRWRPVLVVVSLLVIGVGGISGAHWLLRPRDPIVIAGKLGTEPDILIHMYADLIKVADPKAQITLKPNFGQTSFLFSALQHGQVDIYPEFSGTVLESLVKTPAAGHQPLSATQTYQSAKSALASQDQMTYLKPMRYNNTYALAVKASFARKYHLRTISDLVPIERRLTAGMTLEFIDRPDGLTAIERAYGLKLKVKGMQPALRYEAIAKGDVNLVDAFSTDSDLQREHLVTLTDNRHVFPPYQGAPLLRDDFARQHPAVVTSLNRLAGHITDQQMRRMNYLVDVKHQSAATVARRYLESQHLLKGGTPT